MDLRSLSAWLAGASGSQGLQRLLWLSDAAGAARLLRWWGKVGMSSGSQGRGFSLKYELSRQSPAVALFFGSYMKSRFSRRKPASESHGNLCFRLL